MKKITLPAPVDPKLHACDLLEQAVMTLPWWRTGRDVKRLDAMLAIEKLLPEARASGVLVISDGQQELLGQALESAGLLPHPAQNRLFNETLRAVLVAEDVP